MEGYLVYGEIGMGVDFIIIGAMKCATSTLHSQLASHDSFFMSEPKEPNFFSDDGVYAKGVDWYEGLFQDARPHQLKGESSTHYTKLPTYPQTLARLSGTLTTGKFIYMMRHPVDRLISHYIHGWTEGTISSPINEAVLVYRELVDYGCYAKQLEPYCKTFGQDSVLPVFVEAVRKDPQQQLERIFSFLGVDETPFWKEDLRDNVSSERMRKCGWRDTLLEMPVLKYIRRRFVPKSLRTRVRRLWTMEQRPELTAGTRELVERRFDEDLEQLGNRLGLELSCHNFSKMADLPNPVWKNQA